MQTVNTEYTSPLHLLHRAAQCVEDLFHVATNGFDITPRQFLVLENIARREGLSQTDLVKCTGVDRSTMTDIVGRLVKKRFVQRQRTANDARAYTITLTPQGRAALEEAKSIMAQVDKEFLSVLPRRKAGELLGSLAAIVRAFRTSPMIESGRRAHSFRSQPPLKPPTSHLR
jgi:MarR family transcriptional regulator, temperature-dependent positive regulator of motility